MVGCGVHKKRLPIAHWGQIHIYVKYCWILPNIAEYCGILWNITEYCWLLSNIAELGCSLRSHPRSKIADFSYCGIVLSSVSSVVFALLLFYAMCRPREIRKNKCIDYNFISDVSLYHLWGLFRYFWYRISIRYTSYSVLSSAMYENSA